MDVATIQNRSSLFLENLLHTIIIALKNIEKFIAKYLF